MILYNLIQTCGACPSQWEATNERGEAAQILKIEHVRGIEHAGYMEEEEMLKLTGYTLAEQEQ